MDIAITIWAILMAIVILSIIIVLWQEMRAARPPGAGGT